MTHPNFATRYSPKKEKNNNKYKKSYVSQKITPNISSEKQHAVTFFGVLKLVFVFVFRVHVANCYFFT